MADNLNISFLQGEQSSLDALMENQSTAKNIKKGAFYLTNDTFRLYYGAEEDKLVAMNEGVTTVANLDALPPVSKSNAGNFYYVTDSNILCVSNGKDHWVQINPDTDTNTSIQSLTVSNAAKVGDNYEYTITLTQQDKDGTLISGANKTAKIVITPDMVANLAVEVEVGLTSTVSTVSDVTSATLTTTGVGNNEEEAVKIIAGSNIGISATKDGEFTISAIDTTYDLDVVKTGNKVEVALMDSEDTPTDTKIEFAAGTNLAVSADGDKITYSHTASGVTAETYGSTTLDVDAKGNKQKITMPVITVDAQGHVTAADEAELTIVNNTYDAVAATLGSDAGTIITGIKDEDGTQYTATSGKILKYNITVDGTEVTKYNTESLGSFYSKGALDTKFEDITSQFRTIDAMVYRGVIDSENPLPTSGVKNGDTYKVGEAGVYGDVSAKAGDIFIAHGTENADGILSPAVWDKIESGDIDTQYTLKALNNEIILTDSIDREEQKIAIVGGNELTATTADDGKSITIDHDTMGQAGTYGTNEVTAPAYGDSIIVPQIQTNAYGHVIAVTDQSIKLPSEIVYDLENVAASNTIYITQDKERKGSLQVADDTTWIDATLTASGENNKAGLLTISHNDVTRTNTNGTAKTLGYGDEFSIISKVTSDAKGHITGVETTKVTLPGSDNTTYTLSGATTETLGLGTTSVKFTSILEDNEKGKTTSTLGLYSDTLTFTLDTANNAAKVELVWGTF